ncbi:MAG: SHOCT domain-containing protein [Caulobacteraceae bacterium]|nr:SHOCT domain-containing protein [Caulobacteraceae bacterium]
MQRPTPSRTSTALAIAAALGLAGLGLTACGGGGATTAIQTQTTGQQLIDLKAALDAGVITQREYDAKRRDILRQH